MRKLKTEPPNGAKLGGTNRTPDIDISHLHYSTSSPENQHPVAIRAMIALAQRTGNQAVLRALVALADRWEERA